MNSLPLPVATDDAHAAIRALQADGPHPANREKLRLFGQFVGSWDMDIQFYNEQSEQIFHGPGEWSFSWILDGRAVQDVLAYAPITDPAKTDVGERRIGTTLRYYDAELDAWRMVWLGATSGVFLNLTARPEGDGILIEGTDMDGSFLRWSFSEITATGFHWTGKTSRDQQHWRVEQEMFALRRGASIR